MGGVTYYEDRLDNPRRCRATNTRGEPCGMWAMKGSTVCRMHGGAAGQVKRKAKQRLEEAADRMAKELLGIATSAESEAVKLNAVRDALDRAGLGAKQHVEVEVEAQPWEQLFAGIAATARPVEPAEIVDAEVLPAPEPAELEPPAQQAQRGVDKPVGGDAVTGPPETPTPPTSRSAARPTARPTAFMTAEEAAAEQRREQQRQRRSRG